MRRRKHLLEAAAVAAVLSSFIGLATSALAQNTSAEGSVILPVPEPLFRGVIGRKASESKPDFPKGITAPKGAPNILLILTDDTGFGASGTFGGPSRGPATAYEPTTNKTNAAAASEIPDRLPIMWSSPFIVPTLGAPRPTPRRPPHEAHTHVGSDRIWHRVGFGTGERGDRLASCTPAPPVAWRARTGSGSAAAAERHSRRRQRHERCGRR